MWSRSQYRGVDFYASQASGVDFMGRNNFKILKEKSQKNRLRVWHAATLVDLTHATRGTPPVRILWGKGARRPNRHMCASNAHGTGTSHAQRGSCAKRAVVLLRLGTNAQNGKNFRNAEASRQRCSPHPLVQTIDSRHDTDVSRRQRRRWWCQPGR